jgi:predicted PurR-regulated permease PerM
MVASPRDTTAFILSSAALLGLIIVGRELLVPLVFAMLLWAVLNAMTDFLVSYGAPRWLAWTGSISLVVAGMYLMARIFGDEAAGLAAAMPGYAAKLQTITTQLLAPLRIKVDLGHLFSAQQVASFLASAAASVGGSLFAFMEVLIYVGFLLAEQGNMAHKLALLQRDPDRHTEVKEVVRTLARQVQSYLGVCTGLSAVMAIATYVLLRALGVEFAGFWALVLFVVTYIPTVGAVGVVLPALMALVQFGEFWQAGVIIVILGLLHFLLMNVAETVILGQTLNLSPFAIIVALAFWGLCWGAAGLFLAVPVTGAIAIMCGHIDGLRWISVLLAAPPPHIKDARRLAAKVDRAASKVAG